MAAAFCDLLHRNWQILRPPVAPPKTPDALRFGILGTSRIAPIALINPARSHPFVVVVGIASRSAARAATYAKQHRIPRVFDSYESLVASPDVDAVYIPLPNAMHYEWAARALEAGKHVLLEKPSTANAAEAEKLFELAQRSGLVLLEARHSVFQPSWEVFLRTVRGEGEVVERARVTMSGPGAWFGEDDFRFSYEQGGGAMLDLGTYHAMVLRSVFGEEPVECLNCVVSTCDPPNERCDYKFDATFRFPNGGTGEMYGNLKASMLELTRHYGKVEVWLRKRRVQDATLPANQEKWVTRKVTFHNFCIGALWHRISVEDQFEVVRTSSGETVSKWTATEVKKAYTFAEAGRPELPGEKWWLTYRWMLEEFVNRVRGRKGSGAWVSGGDSVAQMRMLDMAYMKAGLPVRKGSSL